MTFDLFEVGDDGLRCSMESILSPHSYKCPTEECLQQRNDVEMETDIEDGLIMTMKGTVSKMKSQKIQIRNGELKAHVGG